MKRPLLGILLLALTVVFLSLLLISVVSDRTIPLPPTFTSAFLALALAFLYGRSRHDVTGRVAILAGVAVGATVGLASSAAYALILLVPPRTTSLEAYALALLPASLRLLIVCSLVGFLGAALARASPAGTSQR